MSNEPLPADEPQMKSGPKKIFVKKPGARGARGAGLIKVGEADNYVWGIPSGLATVSGRILSIDIDRACDVEELEDTDGEVDGAIFMNNKTTGTLEVLVPATFTDIELATSLEVAGFGCFVDGFKKRWEKRGWAKYTCNFRGWDLIAG
jgi:hypothetical protein